MRGAGQYPQRYEEGFAPFLERVKQVNIMSTTNSLPLFYVDVPNTIYGILACEDPFQDSPQNRWIVLVPKYLTEHSEIESDDTLKDTVCPSYKASDPLFVGRLAEPLYVGFLDKNGGAASSYATTAFVNTHPFITNTKAVYSTATSAVGTGKNKTGNDPRVFAYYIDLNVDGRTRCAGGDIVQTAGESAPNVWL